MKRHINFVKLNFFYIFPTSHPKSSKLFPLNTYCVSHCTFSVSVWPTLKSRRHPYQFYRIIIENELRSIRRGIFELSGSVIIAYLNVLVQGHRDMDPQWEVGETVRCTHPAFYFPHVHRRGSSHLCTSPKPQVVTTSPGLSIPEF